MRYNHYDMLPERAFKKKVCGKGLQSLEGGGGNTNTVQSAEPWSGIQPSISNYLSYTDAAAKMPYQGYTGQLYARNTGTQNQAIQQAKNMASAGTPSVINDANASTSSILNGSGFINSPGLSMSNPYAGLNNPYTDSAIEQAQKDTIRGYQTATAPSLDAQANMAGAFGGSGWQTAKTNNEMALGNTLAKQASDLRMNDYNMQIGLAESGLNRAQTAYDNASTNQARAAALAPNLAQTGYSIDQNNLNNLYTAGALEQQNNQNILNEQQNKMYDQLNWANRPMDLYGRAISTAQGTPSISTSQNASSNPYTTAAGVGMAALGVYGAGASAGLWGGGTAASLIPLLF